MNFSSPLFLFFLPVFLALYTIVRSHANARLLLLASANFLFLYLAFPLPAWLMVAYAAVSYAAAVLLARSRSGRGAILLAAITANVALIFSYRYYQNYVPGGFFPLGLSFYSFVVIGYLVDLYLNQASLCRPLEYAAAVGFFPTVASGPIFRMPDLLAQLGRPAPALDSRRILFALVLIANGLGKKGISKFCDSILFTHVALQPLAPGSFAWIESAAFVAKLYADFSGYSDIAIGVGHLLGVDVPANFRLPFLSDSAFAFWRRWHISLNHWLEIYVLRPLVYGNFFSFLGRIPAVGGLLFRSRLLPAVLLTAALSGIWHGFSLNYLAWGLYMGAAISLSFALDGTAFRRLPRLLRIAACFLLIVTGFAFFMETTLTASWARLAAMYSFALPPSSGVGFSYAVATLGVLVVPHAIDAALLSRNYFRGRPIPALASIAALLTLHYLLIGFTGEPFVYFRF